MAEIKVKKALTEEQLKELGVFGWPIWTKESSEFAWSYDDTETC